MKDTKHIYIYFDIYCNIEVTKIVKLPHAT